MNADLHHFVRESLARGIPRPAIAATLRDAGWPPEEIEAELAAWADVEFAVPVPRRRPYLSAREAFLYLVMFATLYTTAFNVGVVLFGLLDLLLPDPSQRWESARRVADAARGATAGIVVAFPVFLLLARAIGSALAREPEKRESRVRKWLTYTTLFVAAMVLIGDLTFLVSRLLSGELPLRVLLKVVVVFAIAATIFGHYLSELRRDDREGAAPERDLRVPPRLAAIAVFAVLAVGFFLSGPPARERKRQLDGQRVEDLQEVSRAIAAYAEKHGNLPPMLDPVTRQPEVGRARFQDPVTHVAYDYRVLGERRYQLCATFDASDSSATSDNARFWWHPAGHACFTFDLPRPGAVPSWPIPGRPESGP